MNHFTNYVLKENTLYNISISRDAHTKNHEWTNGQIEQIFSCHKIE